MALGHVGVNTVLVVRAVRREGGDRVRDLVQQGADLGGVVLVAVGQRGGHDPAGLGVHAEMELPPRPAPLGAVLLDQPLARAGELQPRAVDQQVHGAGIAASAAIRPVAARLRPRHLQRLGPAAQGGVVRHGEVEPEQADDGADQPFGLPVRQPEHGLERQRRQDRQVGILGLPAPARAPLGLPRLDRLVRKPDRQAATPAQALVVIAPVRDLALLLRNVAASVLVQLEGQGGHPGSDGGLPCYLDRAPGATRGIPATTCHLTEFGVIAAKGPVHTSKLIAALEDPASDLPQAARAILAVLVEELRSLDERVAVLDREIARHTKENAVARRLMTIPGIGAVTAAALTALAPPAETVPARPRLCRLAWADPGPALERGQGAA